MFNECFPCRILLLVVGHVHVLDPDGFGFIFTGFHVLAMFGVQVG
jgi:hypothetical protein